MASANPSAMSKVDLERADVLRAELARLCWLALHDKAQGGESARLLQDRLAALRAAIRDARADDV